RLVVIDGQNSVVGSPNISTDILARRNITNKLHQFAQKEGLCLIGVRNEDPDGRALGPQSMGDVGRGVMRSLKVGEYRGQEYFKLDSVRPRDAARKRYPPMPYSVEDLGGNARRILWGKVPPEQEAVRRAAKAGEKPPPKTPYAERNPVRPRPGRRPP